MSRIHCVVRETGTPKDRGERFVSVRGECEKVVFLFITKR
jgi:hypothetical protein